MENNLILNKETPSVWDEDMFRDYRELNPLETLEPLSRQSAAMQIFSAYQRRDEKMIEDFTTLLSRKINRLDKLRETNLFDLSDAEAQKVQRQIDWMEDEVHTLSYIAKLIVRNQERWFEPEMVRISNVLSDACQDAENQATEWKSLFMRELDSEMFYTTLALQMTEKYVQAESKLTRYQTLFIQNNIQLK
jgi:hypothetical protein